MHIVRSNQLPYIPASHENTADPGVYKKVLFTKQLFPSGQVQMVNWAKLPIHKAFQKHYHEDMAEVFILITGNAKMQVADETEILGPGDGVFVPVGQTHRMQNIGAVDVEYIVFGIATGTHGKTIT